MPKGKKNLLIWEKAEATDPAYTKQFRRAGGFTGTATNPTYLSKKATELFGPIGLGWGFEIDNEEYREGANGTVIHIILLRFWYRTNNDSGELQRYELIQFGQTTFVGENKNGMFTDEEAPKKTLTDAMTKCLSLLGFAADIHMGMYDDNKYVNDISQRFAEEKAPPSAKMTSDQGYRLLEAGKVIWPNEDEILPVWEKRVRNLVYAEAEKLKMHPDSSEWTKGDAETLIQHIKGLVAEGLEEINQVFGLDPQ